MYLTKYGIREWLGSGIIVLVIISALFYFHARIDHVILCVLVVFLVLIWLCVAAFFRDPERSINQDRSAIVSPADGTVSDIEIVKNLEECKVFGDSEVVRVGIFLSVFNVHLNRAPCDVTVNRILYREGGFHDARDKRAIKENESNAIFCTGEAGNRKFGIVIKQISGAIARRIVCRASEGMRIEKGQRYGMIKFGSRTEIYLPVCDFINISVQVGTKVSAGTSIIANVR